MWGMRSGKTRGKAGRQSGGCRDGAGEAGGALDQRDSSGDEAKCLDLGLYFGGRADKSY